MLQYGVLAAAIGIGLIGGSEISMMTVAAASKYKWRTAWRIAFIGLATFIPILALLYFFFTSLHGLAVLAAGIVIFLLGINFLYEGAKKRISGGGEDEDIRFGASAVGVYAGIIVEEAEMGSIITAIGAASGGSYALAILGMLIGISVPLIAIRAIKPFLERIPEWALQVSVGTIMMIVASLIILFRF